MNKETFKGNWKIAKGRLKQKYSNLTDDDLKYVEGKEDELLGRLQKKTGETREKLESLVASSETSAARFDKDRPRAAVREDIG